MTNDDRLVRALRASRDAALTGAIRIEADHLGVALFFDGGQVYFASLDGEKPGIESFERAGISHEMLQQASKAPRSGDRFADALMSVGARGQVVRAFARSTIIEILARCAGVQDTRFTAHDRRHPYGPAFTFDVDDLLTEIGVLARPQAASSHNEPEPPAPSQPDFEAGTGLGFRRRTGLKAAAAAAQNR